MLEFQHLCAHTLYVQALHTYNTHINVYVLKKRRRWNSSFYDNYTTTTTTWLRCNMYSRLMYVCVVNMFNGYINT